SAGPERYQTGRAAARRGLPAWPGGPARRRRGSRLGQSVLSRVCRPARRAGFRDILPAESLHRRGAVSPDSAQGAPAETVVVFLYSRAAAANAGVAGFAAVRGRGPDRILRALIRR